MKVFLNYKLYSSDLNPFIERSHIAIPPCWDLPGEQFASCALYYKKMMARLMLIDLINNHFNSFQNQCAGLSSEKNTYQGLSLSISYSGNLVIVAAASDGFIGIDVEKIEPIAFDYYRQEYTLAEWKQVDHSIDTLETFYTIWTRKESVLKADGRGLSQALASFSVVDDTVKLPSSNHLWYLTSFNLFESYIMSIASSEKHSRIELCESQIPNQ